jgi:hypothetical protein
VHSQGKLNNAHFETDSDRVPRPKRHSVRACMRISGSTDRLDREFATGWVLDLDDPCRKIKLRIIAGDLVLGDCVADSYREDLWRLNIGDGHCAFNLKIPIDISDAQAKTIQFQILNESLALQSSARLPRVGYLAINTGAIPFSAQSDGSFVMQNTGGNTGNLAFWFAARRMFDNPIALIEWNPSNLYCKNMIDKLLIPAANQLSSQWDQGPLATLIERLNKEVIVFGLGAQAENESDEISLPKGTVRYLQVLSAHARTIFVRGTFTAELCARYGVKNVQPIGCPSILINLDQRLGSILSSRWGNDGQRLYAAAAAYKENTNAVESTLFSYIKEHPGSTYVLQDNELLIDCAQGRKVLKSTELDSVYSIRRIIDPKSNQNEFLQTFSRVTRCYGSVRAWLEAASLHDRAICTRIHGAIISLSAGIPTIVVAHDARMRELCDAMEIPWIGPEEIGKDKHFVEHIFSDVPFDGQRFDRKRTEIAADYVTHLEAAGLVPSSSLTQLSQRSRKAMNMEVR